MSDTKLLKEKVKDLKVLFVDDELDVRNGTGVFLRKFFDEVVVSSDGKEALDTFKEDKNFDVLITDILMPVMDGVDLAKEIRKISPNMFIIFLTASRGIKDYDKELSNITLKKPLSFEDMIFVMKQLGELS